MALCRVRLSALEVDDETNTRGPGVSEKERGKGGARARVGPVLGLGCCSAGWAGSHRRREGERGGNGLLLRAKREKRERLSPSGFSYFPFSFLFPRLYMHMFK